MTGFGLVFLANHDEAERAKRDLHRQYIGKRYVELSSPDPIDKWAWRLFDHVDSTTCYTYTDWFN